MKQKCVNAEHILAARDPEGSLELVLLSGPELMVVAGQVEVGENARAPRLVNERVNVRKVA